MTIEEAFEALFDGPTSSLNYGSFGEPKWNLRKSWDYEKWEEYRADTIRELLAKVKRGETYTPPEPKPERCSACGRTTKHDDDCAAVRDADPSFVEKLNYPD